MATSKYKLKRFLRVLRANYKLLALKFVNDNKCEKENIIFIVGCGRSGNTLLRKLIANNFPVVSLPEFYQKSEIIKSLSIGALLEEQKLDRLIKNKIVEHPEFHTFNIKQNLVTEEYFKKSGLGIGNKIYGFYELFKKVNFLKNRLFLDKTPIDIYVIRELAFIFPNSKFIYIERNPIDVINSYKSSSIKNKLFKNIYYLSERWIDSRKAFDYLRKKHSERLIKIKYEELVTNQTGIIDNLENFLAIKRKPNQNELIGDVKSLEHHSNINKPIFTDSIGRGYREMGHNDISIIKSKLKKWL